MDQYIGKLLDNRYELLERIGTGGMAVVYKALCHRLNRLVAVKILKPELAEDAEFRRRFHDESQAVAMLSHPNIVAVYDVSRSDDLEYIVMELIDGITLKQYMQKRGAPLNWREALHFTTQIIKALGHAHGRGIVHRDIKPHNIMVLRDGSVKVADFGIARLTSAAQSTLTQEALGSVHYISPEQARGSHIDGRSDLYSAGVVLYEMITGRLPFEGETPVSVAIQHINSIPIPPRELNPEIPEALEAITLRAMAPGVDQRYASADEMLADLEEFRKNPNISFEYTPDDLHLDEEGNEPTQVVSAAHIRAAENEDSLRRRKAAGEAAQRRREERYDDDDYDEPRRRRGVSPALIAVGVILLFVVGVVAFLWQSFFSGLFTPPASKQVPSLLGQTMEQIYADADLNAAFRIEQSDNAVASSTVPAGQVVSQDPAAGSSATGERPTITVTLSNGPETDELTMPPLVGKDYREVETTLRNMGIAVKKAEEESESITEGFVVSTDPAAGEPLEAGEEVTVVVSTGPLKETFAMPLLLNMKLEDAQKALTDLNLVLRNTKEVSSETVEAGLVVYQSIPYQEEVEEGAIVDLQVSTGPANPRDTQSPTTPPDNDPNAGGTEPVSSPSPSPGIKPVDKTVTVNLSNYLGTVQVRVFVGDTEFYNNPVDSSVGSIPIMVNGTGTQRIRVYIDGTLADEYDEIFTVE